MFSKAKRFGIANQKNRSKDQKHHDHENQVMAGKPTSLNAVVTGVNKMVTPVVAKNKMKNADSYSECSSTQSVKSFVTPKPIKFLPTIKPMRSVRKPVSTGKEKNMCNKTKALDELVADQEVEIRNKDQSLVEYVQQIEELKTEISNLQKQVFSNPNESHKSDDDTTGKHNILDNPSVTCLMDVINEDKRQLNELKSKIILLECQCHNLEQELSSRQVELTSYEEIVCIRDSLCQDLQNKLTDMEKCLVETQQRLEMVKGHHALALEANESIRREYKLELDTLRTKVEEEKQAIVYKSKIDQENLKSEYKDLIEQLKDTHDKEKVEIIASMQQQILTKQNEMKAKLEQINEATQEKLCLCEIQFEERSKSIQEHWSQQQEKMQYLKKEMIELKYSLNIAEDKNFKFQDEINNLKVLNETLTVENHNLIKEVDDLKDKSKNKCIDLENEINKLTVKMDQALTEKNKSEISLNFTRDVVEVLTGRVKTSDDEIERLESQVLNMINKHEIIEEELSTYKKSLSNTVLECIEYKDALVNILKSKAALTKEHNRILEHNVALIESLQNVEKEAYRELGSIKNEHIEGVEILKKESTTQIKILREEVEKKKILCELATEHAGQAAAAVEQGRALLVHAASELSRLEGENLRLQQQIDDQQSLVVELSLLRQENEELSMTVVKQASLLEKMKKDADQLLSKPKSPSVHKKSLKIGKENNQVVISPLRERNH